MQYFFILGREPALSLAEIKTVLAKNNVNSEEIAKGDNFLILDLDQEIDAKKYINVLAGTIKIGKIILQVEKLNEENFLELIPNTSNRVVFGISTYNFNTDLYKLGKNLKNLIKEHGKPDRFAVSKENPLSSVAVAKNKLIEKGIEFNLFKVNAQYSIGQTLAVQDFERYSKLDYGRPAPDATSGMLPPKLAQMMLNISGANSTEKLLDPFCGSGTVLQQAVLLGFQNLSGSDISQKAIEDSKKNLDWLRTEYKLNFTCDLNLLDIKKLETIIKPNSIDVIVTEPDLGPPLRGFESPQQLKQNIFTLERLYQIIFEKIHFVLKKNGVVTMIVPEIRTKNNILKFNTDVMLAGKFQVLGHWQYARPNQHVVRNIYKLKKI